MVPRVRWRQEREWANLLLCSDVSCVYLKYKWSARLTLANFLIFVVLVNSPPSCNWVLELSCFSQVVFLTKTHCYTTVMDKEHRQASHQKMRDFLLIRQHWMLMIIWIMLIPSVDSASHTSVVILALTCRYNVMHWFTIPYIFGFLSPIYTSL